MTNASYGVSAPSTLFENAEQLHHLLQSINASNHLILNENRDIIPASFTSSIWPTQQVSKRLLEFQFMLILSRGKHLLNGADDIHLIRNIAIKLGLVKGSSRSLHEHVELNDILLKVFAEMGKKPQHNQAEFVATLGRFYRRHKEELSPYAYHINNSIAAISAKLLASEIQDKQAESLPLQNLAELVSSKSHPSLSISEAQVPPLSISLESQSHAEVSTIVQALKKSSLSNSESESDSLKPISTLQNLNVRVICNKLKIEVETNSSKAAWDIDRCYQSLTNKQAFTKSKDSIVEQWLYVKFLPIAKGSYGKNEGMLKELLNAPTLIKNLGLENAFTLLCRVYQLAYEVSNNGSSHERMLAKEVALLIQASIDHLLEAHPEKRRMDAVNHLKFDKKLVTREFIEELYTVEINKTKKGLTGSLAALVLLFGVYYLTARTRSAIPFRPKDYCDSPWFSKEVPKTLLKGNFDLHGTCERLS